MTGIRHESVRGATNDIEAAMELGIGDLSKKLCELAAEVATKLK